MIDLEALAARREALKVAKDEASEKLADAKNKARTTRNEANRAVGQKLPNATEAQEAAEVAKRNLKDAEAQYKACNDALQVAVKEETDAIKEKQKEDEINDVMSSYDYTAEQSDEYLGVFYDESLRYVGFDIGIAGRAEASFNIDNLHELDKLIASLQEIAKKMS